MTVVVTKQAETTYQAALTQKTAKVISSQRMLLLT